MRKTGSADFSTSGQSSSREKKTAKTVQHKATIWGQCYELRNIFA
jgi:hypothetical protein